MSDVSPLEIVANYVNDNQDMQQFAGFWGMSQDEVVGLLVNALCDWHHLLGYGIHVSPDKVNKELGRLTRGHNHGRKKGVSLRRPSPRLSKAMQDAAHTQAILNLTRREI